MIEVLGRAILEPILGVYFAEKRVAPKVTETDFKYYEAKNSEIVRRSDKLLSAQKARRGYSVSRAAEHETMMLMERDILATMYEAELEVEKEKHARGLR